MVKAQDYDFVVDDVKRVAELPRVSDSGHLFQMPLIPAQESNQFRSAMIGEPEDHAVIDLSLGRVAGDPPQYLEAAGGRLFNRGQVAVLEVRPDSFPGGRKAYDVSLDVALHSERQVDKGRSTSHPFRKGR